MLYILQNSPWFILLIGALVFFHELGHFLVAKAFNVKVVRFSMGFGPKLLAKTWGETEYTVSLLPLGGYVKMVGEDPADSSPEDAGRTLSEKPLWQRSAIVLAGPVANLLLAVVVYLVMFSGTHTFGDTKLGIVTVGDPAYVAGIRPGDKITAVAGAPIRRWDELQEAIGTRPNQDVRLRYLRAGVETEVVVHTAARPELDPFNQTRSRGKAGLSLQYVRPVLAVPDPQSPAAKAGLSAGDLLVAVHGDKVTAWHEVRAALLGRPHEPLSLTVQRGSEQLTVALQPGPYPAALAAQDGDRFSSANLLGPAGYTGLVAANVVVAEVAPDSPAARAGLQPGDRLLNLVVGTATRQQVGVWEVDLAAFGLDTNTALALEIQRGQEVHTYALHLMARDETDEFKQAHRVLTLGAQNDAATLGTYTYDAPVGVWTAGTQALAQVGEDMSLIGRGIVKMVRGEIPLKNMGGPIMLFVIAEKSAKRGWDSFGRALAMTSVNLGLLNVLPVPMLDGGHLLFYALEAITRRPVSNRVREVAHFVGLGLLLLLMAVVFRNDIARFFFGMT